MPHASPDQPDDSPNNLKSTLLRPAVLEDKNAIEQIYKSCVSPYAELDNSTYDRLITSGGLFVAKKDGVVIGFAGLDLASTEPLKWLYVNPEQQGEGVGSKLLAFLESRAWKSGLQALRTHAAPDAVQFYLKHGYHRLDENETSSHDHAGVEMVKQRP
jgi:GNAT superfamily N-acetyltransferase